MEQTKAQRQKVPPILREETAKGQSSKNEILTAIRDQGIRVQELAAAYAKAGDQNIRTQLNTENMHLHGQIHVFWNAMKNQKDPKELSQEQKLMSDIQKTANMDIEKAANARGHGVTYLHISNVKSSSGQAVGQHIFERLVHPEIDSAEKLYNSVEPNVLTELRLKGIDETFFIKLFNMVNPASGADAENAGKTTRKPAGTGVIDVELIHDVPLRGEKKTGVDPLAEKLFAAEKKNAELLEELKNERAESTKHHDEILAALREKAASIQRELATSNTLTKRTEELNASLQEVLKLEREMAAVKQKRDESFDTYEGILAEERAKLTQEKGRNSTLNSLLEASRLESARLLKRLEKAKRALKTSAEIQNQYDEKVWRIQKDYTELSKKAAAANRELERTKAQLAAVQEELRNLRRKTS